MVDAKKDWLVEHVKFVRGLSNPTDSQKLLLVLFDKADKTTQEAKTFDLIVKNEKALDKAAKATKAVEGVLLKVKTEEQEAREKARKARDHGLIQLGLLFHYANMTRFTRAELLGLLMVGAETGPDDVRAWAKNGERVLAEKEGKKAAQAAPVASNPVTNATPTPPPVAPVKVQKSPYANAN